MKPKTLFVLSLVTLALGVFIAFYERDLPSTDERKAQEKKVLAVETDEVRSVTLESDGERVVLERVDLETPSASDDPLSSPPQTWRLTEPIDARADADAVVELLEGLAGIEKTRDLENPQLDQLGLDAPATSVRLETTDDTAELHVGVSLPLSGDYAVRGSDTTTAYQARLDPGLLELVGRSAPDWRDKRLFVEPRNAIEALALHRGEQEIRLQRFGEDETYRLTSPVADAVDGDRVRDLLSTLVGLEAASFVDPASDVAAYGLDPAQAKLEVTFGAETPTWLLEVGFPRTDDPDRLWVRHGPAEGEREIVEVSSPELVEALEQPAEAWRSKSWATFQVFAVQEARFEGAGDPVVIERQEGGEWMRGKDRIEYSAASDALYPFTEIQARALVPRKEAEARFDLSNPRLTVTLTDGDREEVLHLYPDDGEQAPATLEGRDTVLLIDVDDAARVLEALEALRNAPTVVETMENG